MEEKLQFSVKDEATEYAFDLGAEILAHYDSLVHELDCYKFPVILYHHLYIYISLTLYLTY